MEMTYMYTLMVEHWIRPTETMSMAWRQMPYTQADDKMSRKGTLLRKFRITAFLVDNV